MSTRSAVLVLVSSAALGAAAWFLWDLVSDSSPAPDQPVADTQSESRSISTPDPGGDAVKRSARTPADFDGSEHHEATSIQGSTDPGLESEDPLHVFGRVIESSGQSLAGAQVYARSGSATYLVGDSDENGRFDGLVAAVPPLDLWAAKEGFIPRFQEVRSAGEIDHTLVMTVGEPVRLRFTFADGSTVPDLRGFVQTTSSPWVAEYQGELLGKSAAAAGLLHARFRTDKEGIADITSWKTGSRGICRLFGSGDGRIIFANPSLDLDLGPSFTSWTAQKGVTFVVQRQDAVYIDLSIHGRAVGLEEGELPHVNARTVDGFGATLEVDWGDNGVFHATGRFDWDDFAGDVMVEMDRELPDGGRDRKVQGPYVLQRTNGEIHGVVFDWKSRRPETNR